MLSSAVVDGTVSVEEVLAPFLESSEFQSIDELKHQIDVVFLGGGPLRGCFRPTPRALYACALPRRMAENSA